MLKAVNAFHALPSHWRYPKYEYPVGAQNDIATNLK